MRFSFIKINQHRTFHLDPIYYDEAKAERKERERRVRAELGMNPDDTDDTTIENRIRGKMRRRIKTNFEVTRSARKKSNLRLVVILIALMALFYYLLHAGYDWYSRFM